MEAQDRVDQRQLHGARGEKDTDGGKVDGEGDCSTAKGSTVSTENDGDDEQLS